MRSLPYNTKDHQLYTKCSYQTCCSCHNFVGETTYIECNAADRKYKIGRYTSETRKTLFL